MNSATITPTVPETITLIAGLLSKYMNLRDRILIYNQDNRVLVDDGLYGVVGILGDKPYGSNKRYTTNADDQLIEEVGVNTQETIQVTIWSNDATARQRRFEVIAALKSDYAERVAARNALQFATIPTSMVDISRAEGPRRINSYSVTFNVLRAYTNTRLVESYNPPGGPFLTIEP